MFEAEDVHVRYPGRAAPALAGVSIEVPAGVRTVVVGPNGAGKSTLLRALLGLVLPESGECRFRGRPSPEWSRREMARLVAVVSQGGPADIPLTVREYVEMGRHPYLRPWAGLGEEDRRAVAEALAGTALEELAGRDLGRLSGGELQRAKLAQALAQEPSMLLLDEPTAHLDIGHEAAFFRLVEDRVRGRGIGVLAITHDLNLALRLADRLVLLAEGRVRAAGAAREVLGSGELEHAFGCAMRIVELDGGPPWVVPVGPAG